MADMYRALLIIDPQNDFCKAPKIQMVPIKGTVGDLAERHIPGGSLYVPGADKDMERLAAFIMENALEISDIYVTFDDHAYLDIAHPMWWMDKEGAPPDVFTIITRKDVADGKWIAQVPNYQEWSEFYLKKLEEQGNYPHVIWPYHCIAGTEGAAMVDVLQNALREWEETRFNSPVIVRKGQNPLTEHYSAVAAEVPIEGFPETLVNQDLVKELQLFDQVVVAGEALSHCLANTVRDLIKNEVNPKKIIILSDCTTSVPTFEELGQKFQKEMEAIGVRFMTTEEFNA